MAKGIVSIGPDKFPSRLKEIPDQPKKLFVEGVLPSDDYKFLCVVGARKYTNYGKEVCEQLIFGLRGLPIVIVSGLAIGIDSIVHKSALSAGLKCVAVPGSGLSRKVLYPSLNRGLADKILENGGALISEYEPDFRATVWSFPQRNRIMAGMSDAVLIIEAEKKSGTLITSRLATEYNRDVFTVPGSIFSAYSEGPHLLIKLGATPITSPDDLKNAMGFSSEPVSHSEKNYDDCSTEEKSVIGLLQNPMSKNDLIDKMNMSVSEANAIISMLEIKGLIKESMGEIRLI